MIRGVADTDGEMSAGRRRLLNVVFWSDPVVSPVLFGVVGFGLTLFLTRSHAGASVGADLAFAVVGGVLGGLYYAGVLRWERRRRERRAERQRVGG